MAAQTSAYPTTSQPQLSQAANLINTTIQPKLAGFSPITLNEMQGVSLLDRIDTKYLLTVHQLSDLLQSMSQHYRILDINGIRLNHYRTLYFDTPDFRFYEQHHNGRASRYKVRARKYMDTDLAFFEIKHKTNRQRTIKSRIPTPDLVEHIAQPVDDFVGSHLPDSPYLLEPKLWNEYQRMTLVNKSQPERITIDLNLEFYWGERYRALPAVAIIEVKRSTLSHTSAIVQYMRQMGLRPSSFSKYCAGVWSLYEPVKVNNFKPQIRRLNQLLQAGVKHEFAQ